MESSLLRILDQQLAADDFFSRICLVRSSSNIDRDEHGIGDSASLEDEVSNYRLWPALKYDSQMELMKHVAKTSIPSHQIGYAQGYLTLEYSRRCKSMRGKLSDANAARKESYGIAYLLGRQGHESKVPPVVLLSPNEEGVVITDNQQVFGFYEHFPEMELGEGSHCGSDEFQAAFQIALHRTTTRIEHTSGGGEHSSGEKADMKENDTVVLGLTSRNVTSARKTFSNVEYSPMRTEMMRTEMEKGKKSCPKNESTKPSRRAAPSTKDPERKNTRSTNSLDEVESEQLPVKTVEFSQNGCSGSVSSPEKPFSGEDSVNHCPIARSRRQRSSLAQEREMPWIEMYNQMKADGWSHMPGVGLTPWFYVHPTCKGMKKNELLRTKEAGVDYFTSEDDLMRYARLNLGWLGSVESVTNSPKDAEMADRIKKRKRGLYVQHNNVKQIEVKPIVHKKKNWVKIQKVANKQQVHTPKRTVAPDSPDSSRFSAGSSSHRTRSQVSSHTVSELEADIGVQSAKRKKSVNKKMLKFGTQSDFSNESCVESESESVSGRNSTSDTSEKSSCFSDSDSDSEQSSEDGMYQIMSGSSAWRLLQERFGFTYHSVKYCLPGKENRPGKDSTAEEGVNYFGSLDELRKHLCAYGLPEVKKHLTEDEVCNISRWVRYANIIGLCDGALINPKDVGEPLNFMRAWCMLQKLGMKYSAGYMYPTFGTSKGQLKFERAPEFIVHLARFGIPHIDGIHPSEVLSEDDRFKLDLFIADTDRDCFVRMNPNSTIVNEITPRRTRSGRANESESVKPTELRKASHHSTTNQTPNCRAYQIEFNQLTHQRKFPIRIMSSQMALETLVDCYNIHVLNKGDKDYYCLPYVSLAEGEDSIPGRDYFENIQLLRENLCAYGLPPLTKGSKMNTAKLQELESWVRLANVGALRDEPSANIPQHNVRPKGARKILKGFKYVFSDNTQTYLLPGTSAHKSRLGHNRFNSFIDLVNHVARFGLDDSELHDAHKLPHLEKERLELEVFMASIATFDVGKRIPCLTPMRNNQAVTATEAVSSGVSAVALSPTQAAVTNAGVAAIPSLLPVVDDECDQDSPNSVLPKKPKTGTITKYFQRAVQRVEEAIASTFSPSRRFRSNSLAHDAEQRTESNLSTSSSLNNLSPSCIDTKGDDGIEACFAQTPDQSTSFECVSHPDHGIGTPNFHVETLEVSTGQGASIDVEHYPQAASPNMPWNELWHQMRKSGWKYSSGNELVAFFWIHPSVASMKKSDMVRHCVEGIHYFSSEDDVRRYATKHLGWLGGGTSYELSPASSELSMVARVKKRNQENTLKSEASPPKRVRASSEQRSNADESPLQKSRSSPPNKNGCEESTCLSENEGKAPPDYQPTVRDKLESCQMVLHPNFKKHHLSKSSALSGVSSMEADIKDFMIKSIETGLTVDGMISPSPGFMYVCGGPGTGKTTAVTSCADEMKKWAKHSGYDKPSFCFINMASSHTVPNDKGGITRALLKKLASVIQIDNDADISVFEKFFKKRVVVMVLDEIDMLFKQHGGIGETCLRTLIGWAESAELKFSLIGISNCVNDSNATRVRELGHSPRELVFSTYKENDIQAILEQRLGTHVVDHKALQLISRRVAASTGDARRALEITSNAVGKCEESLTEEELNRKVDYNDQCMPLVKLPHMMRAIREGMPMKHVDIISGLPQAAKVILCIAVTLSHVWGPTAEVSISALKKFCVEASHRSLMDDLGIGHINNLVEMLIDSGLLMTCNNGVFNPFDSNPKLRLGVQLDDVEIALEESLFKIGFYKALADYVERECPRPDGL